MKSEEKARIIVGVKAGDTRLQKVSERQGALRQHAGLAHAGRGDIRTSLRPSTRG
jgi:hypothetical protein